MGNWSDLNNDVLEHIMELLPLTDHHRFSAVCQNWRWVAKNKHCCPTKQLPWLMMGEFNSTKKRKFYNLTEGRHYCIDIPELHDQYWIGSSYGWLFIIDRNLITRLLNPFTREFYEAPPLPRLTNVMKREKSYKVILSHDPSETSNFTVLFLYDKHITKVAFWRSCDSTWTCVPCNDFVFDAIYFRGKFHLACCAGLFVIPDIGPNPKLQLVMVLNIYGFTYLVDFMGELLLVQRFLKRIGKRHYITPKLQVYKLNLEEKYSTKCMSIGDYAIFVGVSCPSVVSSSQFHGCKRNSIYFTDMSFKYFSEEYGRDDLGVYDITKDTVEQYYPREIFQPCAEPPIWLTPNMKKL